MPRIWQFQTHDQGIVQTLSKELKCSTLLAQVLISRGYHKPDTARDFIHAKLSDLHDPELLHDSVLAAKVINQAVDQGRRITIYGDYDVDGVTATAILYECFRLTGAQVDYYIPSRLEEGYGLNKQTLQQLREEDPQRLVISVDCGIASVEEAAFAREIGLDLIITDHHQLGEQHPHSRAVVHPRIPNHEAPFTDLCGAGVALKLAWTFCKQRGDGQRANERMRDFLKSAVSLAAMATIADHVPLVGENRLLVRFGLASLPSHSNLGIQALLKIAKCHNKETLTAEDIGFGMAPRINAAGRLGQARLAVELLTTRDESRALQLAAYLDELNKQRQSVERKILKQAKEMVRENEEWSDQAGLVLSHPDWHPGVIGIVASRVAEAFEKPTILVSFHNQTGIGQGSGRTFGTINLHQAVHNCQTLLNSFGGHPAAIGLTISQDSIETFREEFSRQISQADSSDVQVSHGIDSEVNLNEISHHSIRELDHLGPFGCENRHPLFVSTNVELAEPPGKMGEGGNHLKIHFQQYGHRIRGVAFGKGEWADELSDLQEPLAICYQPKLNHYQGRVSVQIHLIDWKPMSQLMDELSQPGKSEVNAIAS